jgi:prepilin peptidase CpaA
MAVIVAGVIDVRSFRIPNAITFSLLFSGLIYHAVAGGLLGLEASFFGVLFGLGITALLFVLGAMGAGDVKLMAAVGAWLQMPATLFVFVVAALATGLYSFGLLAWQGSLGRAFLSMRILILQLATLGKHLTASEELGALVERKDRRRLVPFAAMIALGLIVVSAWGMWSWAGSPAECSRSAAASPQAVEGAPISTPNVAE